MPRINPVKVKQDADRFEKAGRLDQAIALYRQIVDDNPRDWNTINKIGDLYAKLNRVREASDEYAKVAEFYARDGFLLKAIAIWKKINKLDASAVEPYLNLAELYAKQGLMMEAKSQYQIVVDEHIKRGRGRDASDVLKKMAEIDPGDLKIRSRLADLYVREGNQAMAVDEHVAIADELTKKGHLAEAIQVLDKGLKLDPGSHKLRGELARIHIIQKNFDKAAQLLEEVVRESPDETSALFRLGEAYLGAKRTEDAEAIFKRLLELDPQDHESRVQMGRVCLAGGQFDRAYEYLLPVVDKLIERREGDKAAALLQQITQKNGEHVRSLSKLAEIYRIVRKDSAVASTYSQLTEAYINLGQFEQAGGVLELLISLDPQNQQHRTKLQFVRGKLGIESPAPSSAALTSSVLEVEEEDFEIPSGDESGPLLGFEDETPGFLANSGEALLGPAAAVPGPTPAPTMELSGPLSDQDREFVEEHMAEGRVFRKYGLLDKSVDQFEAIAARFPDHLEARRELKELYKEKVLPLKAAEQCLLLAEVHRLKGDEAAALACEEEARSLTPAPAAPLAPAVEAAQAPRAPEPAPAPLEAAALEPGESEDIHVSLDLEESGIEPTEVAVPIAAAGELPAIDLDVDDTDEELPERFVEEHEPAAAAEATPPSVGASDSFEIAPVFEEPSPPSSREGLSASDAASPLATFDLEPEPPSALTGAAASPSDSSDAAGIPPEIAKVLQEVDSYLALGFVEDAKDALREAVARHPPHEAMLAKARELGLADELLAEPEVAPVTESGEIVLEATMPPAEDEATPPEAASAAVELEAPQVELEPPADEPTIPLVDAEAVSPEPAAQTEELAAPTLDLEPSPDEPAMPLVQEEASPVEPAAPGVDLEAPPVDFVPPAEEAVLPLVEDGSAPAEEAAAPAAELEPAAASFDFEDEMPTAPLEKAAPPPAEAPPSVEALSEPSGEAGFPAFEATEPSPAPAEPLLAETHPADGGEAGGADLEAELGELFTAQSAVEEPAPQVGTDLGDAGLADIFKEFKKGVDKQLGKEDYDTRYNLGIAYKEMGLIDEAIAEFQLAAKDDNRLLECSSMLGICFMDKGMPKLAVKWFEKGLRAPGRSDEEYLGLRYDLAVAHEAAGETEKALSLFTDLYGQDANFRDVANKVRELKAALS